MAWFAAVAFVVLFGAGELGRYLLEGWWGLDLRLVLDAGARWGRGGNPYADSAFLYPPLAAVLAAPLSGLPFGPLSVAFAAVKMGVAAAAVLAVTRSWSRLARGLAVAGVLGSLPFVHDLMLGNSNTLLVAAMVPAALLSSGPGAGVALGLAVAVLAKPLAGPLLLWLLVWRPSVFLGALLAAAVASGLGLVLAGPAAYATWFGALLGGTRFAGAFAGNHGVTALAPDLWLPVAAVTAAGLVVVLVRRGPGAGLVWASGSGILLAPYAGTYSALPLVLGLPVLGGHFHRLTVILVGLSPILTTHPLPFLAVAVLAAGLAVPEESVPAWFRGVRQARVAAP